MPRGMHNWKFIEVKKFLNNYHFQLSHVEGSHYFYVGVYGGLARNVCVPFHGARAINPKTMKSIVRQSGIPELHWRN
jgi:predicted RNA binding protein YcfA (HicA-like mRNA interferase family)